MQFTIKTVGSSKKKLEKCTYNICDGGGWVDTIDPHGLLVEGSKTPCRCHLSRLFRSWVGDELFFAPKLESSPFLHSTWDSTLISMHITQSWSDLLPHVRYVCRSRWAKNLKKKESWSLKITTDYDISKGSVDNTVESDADIISTSDLLIVKTGMASIPNKTLSDALLSAIRRRVETHQKPVWVIDSPTMPLLKGRHKAWSSDLEEYLSEFSRVTPDEEDDLMEMV